MLWNLQILRPTSPDNQRCLCSKPQKYSCQVFKFLVPNIRNPVPNIRNNVDAELMTCVYIHTPLCILRLKINSFRNSVHINVLLICVMVLFPYMYDIISSVTWSIVKILCFPVILHILATTDKISLSENCWIVRQSGHLA